MMATPIFVPLSAYQRECIVVDGRRYCRAEDITAAEIGVGILLIIIVVTYVGWLVMLSIDEVYSGLRIWGLGVVAPLVVLALWLILK